MRHKEKMAGVGRKIKGCGKGHVELDFLTCNRSIAARRGDKWCWDAARLDRIKRGECGGYDVGREGEISSGNAAVVEFDIGRRVDPRRHIICREGRRSARPANIRKIGEYLVNLDDDVADRGGLPVTKPVNVALVIFVSLVTAKSSADSISNGAPVLGRDAVAIKLVTAPVLKENGSAAAGNAVNKPTERATAEAFTMSLCIDHP